MKKYLLDQYGFSEKLDYIFSISEKGNVYIVNHSVKDIDLNELHTHIVGIYFGEWKRGELRLSIEGSQLVGPHSTKNILIVDSKVEKMWMYGLDIPCSGLSGFVMVKGRDFLGSGRLKEGKILNHVPKGRRIHE